jgi:phage terminase small subunit
MPRKPKGTENHPQFLNIQQERFAVEFARNGGAEQAAVKAGYSPKTAAAQATVLLKHPRVSARIEEERKAMADASAITGAAVIRQLGHMAFYDLAALTAADGEFRVRVPSDIAKLPQPIRMALNGWKYDAKGNLVLIWADRAKALELIGRYLALWRDKVELTGKDGADLIPPSVTVRFLDVPPAKD